MFGLSLTSLAIGAAVGQIPAVAKLIKSKFAKVAPIVAEVKAEIAKVDPKV